MRLEASLEDSPLAGKWSRLACLMLQISTLEKHRSVLTSILHFWQEAIVLLVEILLPVCAHCPCAVPGLFTDIARMGELQCQGLRLPLSGL